MLNTIRAYVTCAVLLAVYPALFLFHCAVTIYGFFVPGHYDKLEDFMWGWYQEVVVCCYEVISSVQLKLHSGQIPRYKENIIFISNHQSAMDWVVADFVAMRQQMASHMRFVFKDILKYFPMYGYVWGKHGGVFVKRDGSYNIENMEKTLTDLKEKSDPFYLVLFPEGTRYANYMRKQLKSSQEFAMKREVKVLNNVLTPRAKAFYYGLKVLRDRLDAVYDVTILYENYNGDKIPPSMMQVLKGECKCVHVIFNRIPIENIPTFETKDEAFLWLHKTFHKKDRQVELFNQSLSFESRYPTTKTPSLSKTRLLISTFLAMFFTIILLRFNNGYAYLYTIFYGTVYCWIYAFVYL